MSAASLAQAPCIPQNIPKYTERWG
jgi:hypothetical protein